MTFDPTTNRIPFGLLTSKEQDTLKAWPHGWEFHLEGAWDCTTAKPSWVRHLVYRGKPAPIVDTYYLNVYKNGIIGHTYTVKEEAESKGGGSLGMIQLEIVDGKLVSVGITD